MIFSSQLLDTFLISLYQSSLSETWRIVYSLNHKYSPDRVHSLQYFYLKKFNFRKRWVANSWVRWSPDCLNSWWDMKLFQFSWVPPCNLNYSSLSRCFSGPPYSHLMRNVLFFIFIHCVNKWISFRKPNAYPLSFIVYFYESSYFSYYFLLFSRKESQLRSCLLVEK